MNRRKDHRAEVQLKWSDWNLPASQTLFLSRQSRQNAGKIQAKVRIGNEIEAQQNSFTECIRPSVFDKMVIREWLTRRMMLIRFTTEVKLIKFK